MFDEVSICVNDIIAHPEATVAAGRFAERYSAVLNAYFLKLEAAEIWRWQSANPMGLANQFLIDEEQRAASVEAEFKSLVEPYGCHTTWRSLSQSSDPLRKLACCDIIFANQPKDNEFGFVGSESYLNQLILETRRPVMMIPTGWDKKSIGSRVMLGWNSSAEAMRAASDAMPLLQTADKVIVIDIVKEHLFKSDDDNSPGIEGYLNGKNVAYELVVKAAASGHNGETETFTNYADNNSIDLIVVGGYGHSRLRETIMGGMTKHLIKHASVPVLFSH